MMKKSQIILVVSIIVLVILLSIIIIINNNKPIITIYENNLFKVTGSIDVEYKIYKNGDIYIDENRPKDIEYEAVKEHIFIKNISKSDLEKIKNKLENLNELDFKANSYIESEWVYIINNDRYYVKNINIYQFVLEEYLDDNYEQTLKKREREKSIYNFLKDNYTRDQAIYIDGKYEMLGLTIEEKKIVLDEYKKVNPKVDISDEDLLEIIGDQALKINNEYMFDSAKETEN